MAETAGPKIGDARSLWNFTPSPGWTKDECATLRLCLMKFGIGRWVQIVDSGVLPGKQIQQLNGQTQRLLGQQSLAEYTGMHVDVDRIREDNNGKTGPDIYRKNGLITNTGGKLKKEVMQALRAENQAKYGLSETEIAEIVLEVEWGSGASTGFALDRACYFEELPPLWYSTVPCGTTFRASPSDASTLAPETEGPRHFSFFAFFSLFSFFSFFSFLAFFGVLSPSSSAFLFFLAPPVVSPFASAYSGPAASSAACIIAMFFLGAVPLS